MDILSNFTNSSERDIIISLPKDRNWLEYLSTFLTLKKNGQTLDIIVDTLPKTKPGNNCHFIFEGILRGSMEISKLSETEDNRICISLVPFLNSATHKLPMDEIEDECFKYYYDNSNTQ